MDDVRLCGRARTLPLIRKGYHPAPGKGGSYNCLCARACPRRPRFATVTWLARRTGAGSPPSSVWPQEANAVWRSLGSCQGATPAGNGGAGGVCVWGGEVCVGGRCAVVVSRVGRRCAVVCSRVFCLLSCMFGADRIRTCGGSCLPRPNQVGCIRPLCHGAVLLGAARRRRRRRTRTRRWWQW